MATQQRPPPLWHECRCSGLLWPAYIAVGSLLVFITLLLVGVELSGPSQRSWYQVFGPLYFLYTLLLFFSVPPLYREYKQWSTRINWLLSMLVWALVLATTLVVAAQEWTAAFALVISTLVVWIGASLYSLAVRSRWKTSALWLIWCTPLPDEQPTSSLPLPDEEPPLFFGVVDDNRPSWQRLAFNVSVWLVPVWLLVSAALSIGFVDGGGSKSEAWQVFWPLWLSNGLVFAWTSILLLSSSLNDYQRTEAALLVATTLLTSIAMILFVVGSSHWLVPLYINAVLLFAGYSFMQCIPKSYWQSTMQTVQPLRPLAERDEPPATNWDAL